MKTVMLYRPNSEYARVVDEFIHEFQIRSSGTRQIEVINIDSQEGARIAELYGVMQYPAILVLQSDGFLQKSWEGGTLPLIEEVMAYSRT